MSRRRTSRRNNGRGTFESQLNDAVIRIPVRCQAFNISGSDGSNGMLAGTQQVQCNLSAANQFGVTRLGSFGFCFNQYRVMEWTIRYYPVTSGSGVEDTNGTATSTPQYNATTFAFGANARDPEENPVPDPSVVDAIEFGARMFHTDRPFVYRVRINNPRWLYCYVDDNTAATHRQTAFGQMFAISPSEQTDNNSWGVLVHDIIAEFRGPSSNEFQSAVVARPRRSLFERVRESDEKSDTDSIVRIAPTDQRLLASIARRDTLPPTSGSKGKPAAAKLALPPKT